MIREDFKIGLGQITCIEEGQDTDKIIEAGQDIILIIEVVMGLTQEVIKMYGRFDNNNGIRGSYRGQNYNRNRSR